MAADQQSVGVRRLDHLEQDRRQFALEGQQALGEGGCRHLHPSCNSTTTTNNNNNNNIASTVE